MPVGCKFCIKKVNVEIKKISDDLYSIIDLSEYEFNDINDLQNEAITFKIETPSKETFEVMVPAGRSQIFSVKNKKVLPLLDGKYCISLVSCGGLIKKNLGYYPNMECEIDNVIVTSKDKEEAMTLYNDFKMMKILDEYGDSSTASKIYGDISDMLKGCRSGKKCMGQVHSRVL